MIATPTTIISCSASQDPKWRWLEPNLADLGIRFEFVSAVPSRVLRRIINLAWLRGGLAAVWRARELDADVIVAHGPHLTAWCAFFAAVLGVRAQIMGFSFNFTELPPSFRRRIFGRMLKRVDRLVVFSRFERDLYARIFKLSVGR